MEPLMAIHATSGISNVLKITGSKQFSHYLRQQFIIQVSTLIFVPIFSLPLSLAIYPYIIYIYIEILNKIFLCFYLYMHIHVHMSDVYRKLLALVDPIGTAQHLMLTINRRTDSVPTPNSLWH